MLTNEIVQIVLDLSKSILNSPLIPVGVAGAGAIYFGYKYYKANKEINEYRQCIQQEIINSTINILSKRMYFVACAGSKEESACEQKEAIDVNSCDFLDKNGNLVDLSLYNFYLVHGNSMQYANIFDEDLLFVKKGFSSDDLNNSSFPKILVLRYSEYSEGNPRFKVRRAWYVGNIKDDIKAKALEVMKSNEFALLSQQDGFVSNEWMLDDLINTRLEKFKDDYFEEGKCLESHQSIILSTTFDTKDRKIHFSIHPVDSVVGIVSESYTIKKKG